MLLALLAGEEVPERVTLPTELVVRRSCGCHSQAVLQAAAEPVAGAEVPPHDSAGETLEEVLVARREGILSAMVRAVVGGYAAEAASAMTAEWAGQVLDGFAAAMRDESSAGFLSTLDQVLRQVAAVGGDSSTSSSAGSPQGSGQSVTAWQGGLSALRGQVLPCLSDDEALSRAENLWQQARLFIAEAAQQAQRYRELQAERQAGVLQEIGQALITTFGVEDLMDVMARELPRLDIPSAYLSVYEHRPELAEGGQEMPPQESRLILAYDENGRVELEAGGRRFRSPALVPEGTLPRERRYSMVVEPLYFRDDPLGLVLLEVGPRDGTVYEVLREQISSALEGTVLFQERKRAEAELRQLKEFNEGIVQGMEEGIVMEDAEGHLIFVNPKMAEMLGYTEEELIGKHWSETVAPSYLRQVEEESSKRLAGISSRYEAALMRKDGKEVPGLVSARLLFREGEFVGTLAVCTDLTERKGMEQQLMQAGKLAAIGQLVAGVAHELNNPLTSVVGYSQLLMGGECSEGMKRDLERINRQATRAAKIVEGLLTFARRREPRRESININDVIERSLELQGHQLELDRISIVKELDEALPPTLADPFQMQQVFMNIISNADQALRDWDGERQLRVRSELQGDMIHLEFADSGPGISPQVMERLFEPFFTTKEVGEGMGMGLSIAHGIVEAHGGRIWVESPSAELGTGAAGEGATFIVEIPVVPVYRQ
jgi:PAS domain S-box-containing protein